MKISLLTLVTAVATRLCKICVSQSRIVSLIAATISISAISTVTIAQTTGLYYDSQKGHTIGRGQSVNWNGNAANVTVSSFSSSIQVSLPPPGNAFTSWGLSLYSATTEPLTVGTYDASLSNSTGQPRFSFSTGSGFCTSRGKFVILELVRKVDGSIERLAVDFEQRCEDYQVDPTAGLYGQFRFNSQFGFDTTRRYPDSFAFPIASNVMPGAFVVSATAIITGAGVNIPIAVTGGEYSIDNGAFTASPGVVNDNQRVRVRLQASNSEGVVGSGNLVLGSYVVPFRYATRNSLAPQPDGSPLVVMQRTPGKTGDVNLVAVRNEAANSRILLSADDPRLRILVLTPSNSSYGFNAWFSGPFGAVLTPGTYTSPRFDSWTTSSAYARVDGNFENGLACPNYGDAVDRFTVHEVSYGPQGVPTSLALDYVQTCSTGETNYLYIRVGSAFPIDYAIRKPSPFEFAPRYNVSTGSLVVSDVIMVRGITVPVSISVAGGEYSVDGSSYTSAAGTVSPGQRVSLRVSASSVPNELRTASLTIGSLVGRFSAGTSPSAAQQPNMEPFVSIRSVASNPLTVRYLTPANGAGLAQAEVTNNATLLTFSSLSYSQALTVNMRLNSSPYLAPGTYDIVSPTWGFNAVENMVYLSAAAETCGNGSTHSIRLRIHEIEYLVNGKVDRIAADFEIRCGTSTIPDVYVSVRIRSAVAIDYALTQPYELAFANQPNLIPGEMVVSNEAILRGTNVPVPISVVGGEYSINGGAFTATVGLAPPDARIRLRGTAPSQNDTQGVARVTTGGTVSTFRFATRLAANPQPTGGSLVLIYGQNDYLTGGANFGYSTAQFNSIEASRNPSGGINVYATASSSQSFYDWLLSFVAPNGVALQLGTYTNLQQYTGTVLGVAAFSAGRSYYNGCANPSGQFIVKEANYSATAVTAFAVDFSVTCNSAPAPIVGYIRINSNVPVPVFVDSTPNFGIEPAYGADRSSLVASRTIVVRDFNAPAPITISGGEYSISGGAFTSAAGTLNPGDTVVVRLMSASSFGVTTSAVLKIGDVSRSFDVSTPFAITTPEFFVLGEQVDVARDVWVLSPVIVVRGTNSPAPMFIVGGEVSVNGRPFTSAPTAAEPSDSVQVRVRSSTTYGDYRLARLSIGERSAIFSTKTIGQFTLTTAVTGIGTIAATPVEAACPGACSLVFEGSTSVVLTATPSLGQRFVSWTGITCVTGNSEAVCNAVLRQTTNATATFAKATEFDFSGDGRADLLSQTGAGSQMTLSLLNGVTISSSTVLPNAGVGGVITHSVDLNGDGKSDSILRRTDGSTAAWIMNGAAVTAVAELLPAGSGWTMTHTGDFNADGKGDLLWRHADGSIVMWLMNGTSMIGSRFLLGAGSGWQVTHVTDLNGDGKSDIVWRHTDGSVAVWVMDGTSVAATGFLLNGATGWSVSHTADFDGDGKADILWRHTDGSVAMWLMNGNVPKSTAFVFNGGGGWSVSHVGDLDGDGKADLVWRNSDGSVAAWLMNGPVMLSATGLLGIASGWQVRALRDFNGDGKADILWQHTDGSVSVWLMSGLVRTNAAIVMSPGATTLLP
jgi:FG-GAP-like repeat